MHVAEARPGHRLRCKPGSEAGAYRRDGFCFIRDRPLLGPITLPIDVKEQHLPGENYDNSQENSPKPEVAHPPSEYCSHQRTGERRVGKRQPVC
jgi:hypothetical protein